MSLPVSTTDRLLDGGIGPEPLRQLLAAAAAPAQADELGGEQAAHRAFTTATRCAPLLEVAPHNSRRRARALSWIVAAKAIAAVALTAGAGGVAVAATSGSFPGGLPDVSTQHTSDPDHATARPTVVVDRARGAAQRPGTPPAPASSAGSPDSRHGGTGAGATSTRTVPPARSDQPGRSDTEPLPEGGTPTAPPPVAPGNPEHATGSANSTKESTAKTPPGQQKAKENHGNETAATKKDHVGDPRSDTAEQRQKAQE
jgi:hypothetical protein